MMLKEKFEDTKEIIRTSEAVHSLLGVLTVVMDHSELEYLFLSLADESRVHLLVTYKSGSKPTPNWR
jgi:hypothetical protein